MLTGEGHIQETLEYLRCTKRALAQKIETIDQCISTLAKFNGFESVESHVHQPTSNKITKKKKKKSAPKHKAGHRGPLKQSSEYKGVSVEKPPKSGKLKYRVQYWDGKKRKIKLLGVYDSELEAAAVYQDYIGDKTEAARLRSLNKQQKIDQTKNDPVRSRPKERIWICNHCHIEYRTKPTSCINCDSASFKIGEGE